VTKEGLEPSRLATLPPEDSVSTNSTTWPKINVTGKGVEPSRLTAHAPQTCLSTNSNIQPFRRFRLTLLHEYKSYFLFYTQQIKQNSSTSGRTRTDDRMFLIHPCFSSFITEAFWRRAEGTVPIPFFRYARFSKTPRHACPVYSPFIS
jgi:hypothetical protein